MVPEIKIGILLPQSKQYPFLDRDFMRGIKLNGSIIKFYIESIGIGSDEKMIIEKMQKLHYQEDIKLMAGFFGHRNIESIYDYASTHDIFLLASDMGSNLPYAAKKRDGVYINSFGIAESSYHLGEYLASQDYKNIATSSSYYDSGYGINQAIEIALYQNDAQFSGHYITPLNPRENEADYMLEILDPLRPEAVFAFHSGIYAEEHASYLFQNKLSKNYPFFLTSFSVSSKIIEEYGEAFNDVHVISSWSESLENLENSSFKDKYTSLFNENPSAFSLLGYESGLILESLLENEHTIPSIEALINKTKKLPKGPRGKLEFHPETNRTAFDSYVFRIKKNEYQLEAVLKNDGEFINKIMLFDQPAINGGWHNAYLCH